MTTSPSTEIETVTVWQPQFGPQKILLDCPLPEIFFGGARGGGKTDGVLGKFGILALRYNEHFNALFCRRELPMLDDAIERSRDIYRPLGAKYTEQKKEWRFPGGGRLRFRPLERVDDADKYQGQNVTHACIEEAGMYPDPRPIDRLQGVLRSVTGVPTQLILTGNPGGAGQNWIKQRYIDPAPGGFKILSRARPKGSPNFRYNYIFIPSRIEDNKLLLAQDPSYIDRLHLVGNEQLVRAWLLGDWDAIEAAFFDGWDSDRHIVSGFPIPQAWKRFRSMDWGFARPFSVGWWAIVSDDRKLDRRERGNNITLPRGCLVRYREWYGCERDHPNVGLRLTAEEVGKGIKKIEQDAEEDVTMGVLDPSAFAQDGGPSIAERIGNAGAWFARADNRRVGGHGAMGGWDQMRARLKGQAHDRPMIVCFKTCRASIRTIPALQHDNMRAEDVDTEAEDHCADEWRYACMSRPWMPPELKPAMEKIETGYRTYGEHLRADDDWKLI